MATRRERRPLEELPILKPRLDVPVFLSTSNLEVVLPVPIVKERPALPFQLDERHVGKMIIVYAVINVEGKMEQMLVMERPDPLLNQTVLEALREWVFQPGQLNGSPVAVKALLGMPFWAPAAPIS